VRQPSKGRIQALIAVDEGLVRRYGNGIAWACEWPSDEDTAMTSDAVPLKAIKDVHKDGWIAIPYVPTAPGESVVATLTDKGRAILTQFRKD